MGKQVEVLSTTGQPNGTVELPDALFGAEVSEYALHRAVVAYEANQRQGTASVKTRSEVNRSSKKHHRQKGTGWARRGSLRSPLVRGGGVAFGPQPRSYETRLPKALKRVAFQSALTLKGEGGQVTIVEDFGFERPSTKSFQAVLTACGLTGRKILFVTPASLPLLVKSCRNLPAVQITPVGTLCTYDVVAADAVLFTRQALDRLAEVHAGGADAA
ncbi:MAG: 50S ribosomal protein L4 [Candidatus Latescibacterota bacterium]|jgi:large subunit ribosomal protein L4